MQRRALGAWIGASVLVAALGGGAFWWVHQEGERTAERESRAVVDDFAQAWSTRAFTDPGLRFEGTTAGAVGTSFTTATAGLGSGPVAVKVAEFSRSGDQASVSLAVAWTLPGGVQWDYRVPVEAAETSQGWAIKPATTGTFWHPQVDEGDKLTAKRTQGKRGELLDRSGQPLMPTGKVYPVQLDPARASAATAAALEKLAGEPAGTLVKKLDAAQKAKSQSPIAVITYRENDFEARRAQLDALVGVVYPAREQPLAKTRTFGQPLLGSFGAVSAELVKKSNGRYAGGDFAGLSGLQGQYDEVLAGSAGVTVTNSGKPAAPLFEKATTDGTDVELTLDPIVQEAAESALTGTKTIPSALVAIDVSSGDIIASANSPALGLDRALTGHYPPGSAFKIATTYSLLASKKVTPQTPVACPKTFVVDGMSVKNYEGESIGSPTFGVDFAHSCNTAFVQLAGQLADDDLGKAAKALGIGAGWEKTLGVANAYSGNIPVNNSKTDKAAAAIGQGRNTASPASLAVMAGSVARGSFIPPALVTEPAAAGAARTPQPLDASVVGQLQSLMGQVVTNGTGTVMQGTPGGPVHGKSGTAEFGTKKPPETHAWFVGYQGNVAFAVLVEQGKSGGTVAAPIAKAFLTALAGSR